MGQAEVARWLVPWCFRQSLDSNRVPNPQVDRQDLVMDVQHLSNQWQSNFSQDLEEKAAWWNQVNLMVILMLDGNDNGLGRLLSVILAGLKAKLDGGLSCCSQEGVKSKPFLLVKE